MAKPSDIPRWAEGVDGTPATNIVEPTEGRKTTGYKSKADNGGVGDVPTSGETNWLLRTILGWVKWLRDGTPLATAATVMERDGAGRTKVVDPLADDDVDTRGARNTAITNEATARANAIAAEATARANADAAEATARMNADVANVNAISAEATARANAIAALATAVGSLVGAARVAAGGGVVAGVQTPGVVASKTAVGQYSVAFPNWPGSGKVSVAVTPVGQNFLGFGAVAGFFVDSVSDGPGGTGVVVVKNVRFERPDNSVSWTYNNFRDQEFFIEVKRILA